MNPPRAVDRPFYLFLRYLALEYENLGVGASKTIPLQVKVEGAMRRLNSTQRSDVVNFIDETLAENPDSNALANIFDDGNSYRVWYSDDAPRQFLLMIRKAAVGKTAG